MTTLSKLPTSGNPTLAAVLDGYETLEAAARAVADMTHSAGIGHDDPLLSVRLSDLWQQANIARAIIARAKGGDA